MEEEGLTPEQAAINEDEYINALLGNQATKEDRLTVHNFLAIVASQKDTTRVGNLDETEVGMPKLPLRTYKELALFCNKVANMDYFSDYFNDKGQILTATSLSKDAKLIELAVMQRREITQKTHTRRKENKSWFKRKNDDTEL